MGCRDKVYYILYPLVRQTPVRFSSAQISGLWALPRYQRVQYKIITSALYLRSRACNWGPKHLREVPALDWLNGRRELGSTRNKVSITPYPSTPRLNKHLTFALGGTVRAGLTHFGTSALNILPYYTSPSDRYQDW